MGKFYRNQKDIFAVLKKSGSLYLLVCLSALVLVCLVSFVFFSEDQETVVPPQNTDVLQGTDLSQKPTDTNVTDSGVTDTESSDSSVSDTDTPTVNPEPAPVVMILPVSGTVGVGFSSTVPVFSETMNDWRVHQGIDYLTEGEADVVAAADGIVDNVYVSELMGLTVEVLHADGSISIYQSLSGEASVIEGQEVRQGDVLGKTGASADCECLMGNHLHFAVIEKGIYVDPASRYAS